MELFALLVAIVNQVQDSGFREEFGHGWLMVFTRVNKSKTNTQTLA